MDAEEIVERQLERYNAHDLDGFAACYAEDVEIFAFGSKEPELKGIEALRTRYAERFRNEGLRARIASRIVKGAVVIDDERVEGLGPATLSVVAIYETAKGKIARVTLIR
ncbi:MAG: nuclear transport factor 2 family protein [Spirochaetaceae bacterium]|nr:nuclear transport factor 2 family protein [Spirochaetaceae bacterium]